MGRHKQRSPLCVIWRAGIEEGQKEDRFEYLRYFVLLFHALFLFLGSKWDISGCFGGESADSNNDDRICLGLVPYFTCMYLLCKGNAHVRFLYPTSYYYLTRENVLLILQRMREEEVRPTKLP
jgi:hypothetical protein